MSQAKIQFASILGQQLLAKNWMLSVAESCTGGGLAQALTDIPGSSAWFDRGFVSYSNNAKVEMLGVNQNTLDCYGAVSQETALEMVAGALKHSHADLALAITGIAGPGGGSKEKPVGTVFLAWQRLGQQAGCTQYQLTGDRIAIRRQVILASLQQAAALLQNQS